MVKFKTIIILLIFVLVCSFTYAITNNLFTFYQKTNPFSLNIVANTNTTLFFSVPLYSIIKNLTFNYTGQLNESINYSVFFETLRQDNTHTNYAYVGFNDNYKMIAQMVEVNTTGRINNVTITLNQSILGPASVILSSIEMNVSLFRVNNTINEEINITERLAIASLNLSDLNSSYMNNVSAVFNNTVFVFDGDKYYVVLETNVTSGAYILYYYDLTKTGLKNWHGETVYKITNLMTTGTYAFNIGLYSNQTDTLRNKTIYLNGTLIHEDEHTISREVSLSVNTINAILDLNCTCVECTRENNNCNIPLKFSAINSGFLNINLKNLSYDYGVDKCENTAFNFSLINFSYIDENTNAPLYSTNEYLLNIFSPFEQLLAGKFEISNVVYGHAFCTNINLTKRGIDYDMYGSLIFESPNHETKIIDNNINNPYHINTMPYYFPVYLIDSLNDSTVTFTIKNSITKTTLSDVYVVMYEFINGTRTIVNIKTSSATGDVVFNYIPNKIYLINFSKSGYNHLAASFSPITSSSYDILMVPTSTINSTQPGSRILFDITPNIYYNGNNTYKFNINSPYNELFFYSFNLSYPGGNLYQYGGERSGETFNGVINISGATIRDQVILTINYETELTGEQMLRYNYDIAVPIGNYSIMHNKGNHYGLGLFERILIVTLVALFFAGVATLFGQFEIGIFLAYAIMGFFTYLEFYPIWAMLLSATIALIILAGRAD